MLSFIFSLTLINCLAYISVVLENIVQRNLLQYFTDSVRLGIEKGLFTGVVFIDLYQAFGTVDHELLLKKLERYGIANIELSWLKD